MAGVWAFKESRMMQLVDDEGPTSEKKVLVYMPRGEVVSSYTYLEKILRDLGWERYYGGDPDLLQFHKHASIDLISLPRDYAKFDSIHMNQIASNNPNLFHVRDMY